MKKITSIVVFLALLIWTWNVVHSSAAVGFETHTAIQEKLAALIEQTLISKKPNVENLKVTRVWTENIDTQKVLAHFTYQFSEKIPSGVQTEQAIEGEAVLSRENSENPAQDSWKLLSVKTTNDSVVYTEGSEISPNQDPTQAAPEVAPESSKEQPAAPKTEPPAEHK